MNPILRTALVTLALALLLAAIVTQLGGDERRRTLGAEAEHERPDGALARRVQSEVDPDVAALLVARSIVSRELDPERRAPSAVDDRTTERLARLASARETAIEVLERRPANWQATMILGATRYLIWVIERDTKLFSRAPEWERPLERAIVLAPGQVEPRRFLAAAYLDTWPALSDAKRERASALVRDALTDPDSFKLLIGAWLRVDTPNRFEVIPDQPWAWTSLQAVLAAERDWPRYADSRERWHAAVEAALAENVEEARERLAGGDVAGARTLLTSVVAQTPLGTDYAELFTAALTALPPGPVSSTAERRLRAWFEWTLRTCRVTRCPLVPAVIGRLAGAVRDATAPERAMAALASGQRARAETIERRNDALLEESWADYFVYKARWLIEVGEPAAAADALLAAHRTVRESPRYRQARRRLEVLDQPIAPAAEVPGDTLGRDRWSSSEWHEERSAYWLELWPARTARALSLFVPAATAGGAIDLRWDGRRLGTFVVGSDDTLVVEVEVTPELHQLEIAPITGARPRPGAVRLVD